MVKFKYLVALFVVLFPSISLAATAVCTIEIEDNNASVKNKVREKIVVESTFNIKTEHANFSPKQTKFFDLPDGKYSCRLDFFDMNTGTSLSCEKKEDQGYSYMQSDLTSSNTNKNNLTFRNANSHFIINSICK